MNSFRDHIKLVRPELAARQAENAPKRSLALKLIGLRWRANMTHADIADATGLDISKVRQLESLAGPLPLPDEIERYRSACNENSAG